MSSFFSVGVDAAGNVFPATLTAYPAAAVSGAGANTTFVSQAATTTGASGSFIFNVPAPASGTAEAGISLKRVSTTLGTWQPLIGSTSTYSAFYGGGVTPSSSNYSIGISSDGTSVVFNPSSSTSMFVANTSVATFASTQNTFRVTSSFLAALQGGSGDPLTFANSAVTLATSGTTSLSAAQQGTPNLTVAAVTLTGAAVLDFGNVTGNFQVNIVGVNAASFGTFGLSLKNGTTTTALPSTALSNGGLVIVRCDPNAIAFCA
jgi:hypothetical protein